MLDYLFGLRLTSKLTCSLFAGAAVYINIVEHPARMKAGIRVAITQFQPSFRRAAPLQAVLCSIGSLTAIGSYLLKHDDKHWLYSGLLMLSIIPYTMIFIRPVYVRLLDEKVDKDSNETKLLLDKWNRLHTVRSIIGLTSVFIMLYFN
jgi:hypothetical protein